MLTRRTFAATSLLALGMLPFARAAERARILIGQIGTAHSHAAGKMEAIRLLPDIYEVAGIAEADERQRVSASKAAAYEGLIWKKETELLAIPDLQAVAVETGLLSGIPAALRAIRAGKHVHLDKPGGADHQDFAAMRSEAEKRGVTVQMGYMLRYNPAFALLFRGAREGWFGEITEIDASMGKLAPDGQRAALQQYPGAGMFELACHLVDAVVTILGKPKAAHAINKATRGPADRFHDNQLAVLEYPKASVTLRCNHADPFGGPRRRFFIAGTKGAMEIEPLESGKATLYLDEAREGYNRGRQEIALKLPGNRYVEEFRDLASVIRKEKALAWGAAHDIAVHETALRAAGAWKG